jgi:preprotein translocase subunit SecE
MGPHGSRAGVMAKDNGGSSGWMQLFHELFKTEIYKRSQGRLVRQFTCLAIWVAFALGAYRLFVLRHYTFANLPQVMGANLSQVMGFVVPSLVLLVGLWIGFRIVNLPSFADFLIAVEAEMNKVSWPSRTELIRASIVVIMLMFGLTIVLYTYDVVLYWLLTDVLKVTV